MLMTEKMITSGQWLFRYRGYLPLIFLLVVLLTIGASTYHLHAGVTGVGNRWVLLISLAGWLIRFITVGYLPNGTSGRNTRKQKASVLNTTGVYSIVRNPLYLANYLVGLGLVLIHINIWLVVLYTLSFWLYYERIVLAEEAFLQKKFGQQYAEYVRLVPAIIPRLSNWCPSSHEYSLAKAFRREHIGFIVIVVVYTFIQLFEYAMATGSMNLDRKWWMVLILSATAFIVARITIVMAFPRHLSKD